MAASCGKRGGILPAKAGAHCRPRTPASLSLFAWVSAAWCGGWPAGSVVWAPSARFAGSVRAGCVGPGGSWRARCRGPAFSSFSLFFSLLLLLFCSLFAILSFLEVCYGVLAFVSLWLSVAPPRSACDPVLGVLLPAPGRRVLVVLAVRPAVAGCLACFPRGFAASPGFFVRLVSANKVRHFRVERPAIP